MKKSIVIIAAIVIIGVFAFFMYLKIYGDPLAFSQLEQHVEQYLTEEKGYDPDEIKKIEARHVAMKRPGYYAEVVFKNDPQTVYFYCEEEEKVVPCGKKEASSAGEKPSISNEG